MRKLLLSKGLPWLAAVPRSNPGAAVVTGVSVAGYYGESWHHRGPGAHLADVLLLMAAGASIVAMRRFRPAYSA